MRKLFDMLNSELNAPIGSLPDDPAGILAERIWHLPYPTECLTGLTAFCRGLPATAVFVMGFLPYSDGYHNDLLMREWALATGCRLPPDDLSMGVDPDQGPWTFPERAPLNSDRRADVQRFVADCVQQRKAFGRPLLLPRSRS